jgi:FtsP/CotA-like multicopper oxidase with cupredoxin domain
VSRNQRIGLIVAAVVFAVGAFVIASPGDDDEGGQSAQTTTTQPQSETGEQETPTETEGETEEPHETVPAEPKPTRIQIRGGQVAGGPVDIKVKKGDQVRIVVSSDAPDDIHLHGYDIEKHPAPGKPVTFNLTADIEGIFEIESHVAEDAGKDPLVAKLTVEPS